MGNNNELILVHTHMSEVTKKGTFDIMLTPQFYTLKREPLPVKYAYQAKRIAPSLFEGLLDDNGHYDYFLEKEVDGWLFIAYNSKEIKDFLLTKGIKHEQVKKIFFMQQSIKHLSSALELSRDEALVPLENTVVVVPQIALDDDEKRITFTSKFKPSVGVTFKSSSATDSLLSPAYSFILGFIFLAFTGIFIVEGLRYNGDSKGQAEELKSLFERYPSLKSSYSRDSIASKYRKIDKIERHKREVVKSLAKMIFKGSKLKTLTMNQNKFSGTFSVTNSNIARRVTQLAKKQHFRVKKIGNTLKIEGTLSITSSNP